tara:strand:- start:10869 stop:11744 length:876 start_codon:yes stop_codon:yes gene_type:complete
MMHSMTGYARVELQETWGRLSWELRSVNHRYFDLSIRAPEDFRAMEARLRQLAAKRIARGKVEAGLKFTRDGNASAKLSPDLERVAALRDAASLATDCWGAAQAGSIDPLRLLAFPGVLREEAADMTPVLEAAQALFEQALVQFNEARASEGARLQAFLLVRCDAIEDMVAQVRTRYASAIRGASLDRLRDRAAELGVELDPGRLEQEMVIALQKLDVEEEMSRLLSHLVEVRDALARKEAVGRRLDFLMQELNREANTLSSKSQDAELTRLSVEMKVAIEQMREQVQNAE